MPDSVQSSHPDLPRLAAYGQGNLDAAERAAVQAHLNDCLTCRTTLAALPGADALLPECGTIHVQNTLPPVGPAGPALSETTSYRPENQVPPELASHARYEILKLLGQGGMGAVYKARHKVMNRLVALKVMSAGLVGNASAVERFHREVQAAAKLHHPNIVTAHDADRAGDVYFLVMEFVEGTDLARYLAKKGPLPAALACHFIRQAALGLQHAHERGMVHRDIKPQNLMLTPEGVVKVTDFGLARLARTGTADSGLTGENVLMGTADYIAPEQAHNAHTADIRADLYSLGCTLYHLLAGHPPFEGGTTVRKIAAHLMDAPPLDRLPDATAEGLRSVLERLLQKDPAKRFQTPAELAQALVPFVKKSAGEAPRAETMKAQPARQSADGAREATIAPAPAGRRTKSPPAKKKRVRTPRRWPLIVTGMLVLAVALSLTCYQVLRGRLNSSNHEAKELEIAADTAPVPATPAPKLPATKPPEARLKLLDEVMLKYLNKVGCSAAAIALERKGVPWYAHTYGWRDQEHRVPIGPEAMFRPGRANALLTAASVRHLAEKKRLDLNESIFERLKIVPLGRVTDPTVLKITVEDILEKKVGWDDSLVEQARAIAHARGVRNPVPLETLLGILATQRHPHSLGTEADTPRFGNDMLRHLITIVTGRDPVDYYRYELLGRELPGIAAADSPEAQRLAVWNAPSPEGFCVSAPALLEVMHHFSKDGRRGFGEGILANKGPATSCQLIWRADGIHVVVQFNGSFHGVHRELAVELASTIDKLNAALP